MSDFRSQVGSVHQQRPFQHLAQMDKLDPGLLRVQ